MTNIYICNGEQRRRESDKKSSEVFKRVKRSSLGLNTKNISFSLNFNHLDF